MNAAIVPTVAKPRRVSQAPTPAMTARSALERTCMSGITDIERVCAQMPVSRTARFALANDAVAASSCP